MAAGVVVLGLGAAGPSGFDWPASVKNADMVRTSRLDPGGSGAPPRPVRNVASLWTRNALFL